MGRKYDNAPVKDTCPMIDEIVLTIESLPFREDSYMDRPEALELLETIRTHNSELRKWGNEMYEQCEEKDREISSLEMENKNLKDDISNAESYVKDLEEKISSLENEISQRD